MNRAELTMLAPIEAPLYDVGALSLSDRGMLPGLDGISVEAVLAKLPLLKYRNPATRVFTSGDRVSTVSLCSTVSTRPRS